jgi:hypothetical protein
MEKVRTDKFGPFSCFLSFLAVPGYLISTFCLTPAVRNTYLRYYIVFNVFLKETSENKKFSEAWWCLWRDSNWILSVYKSEFLHIVRSQSVDSNIKVNLGIVKSLITL